MAELKSPSNQATKSSAVSYVPFLPPALTSHITLWNSAAANPLTHPQVQANRDPEIFPDPNTVRTDRPLESYIHYGMGPHTCLGRDASRVALTAMLKVVGRLDNLRRAPGPAGELKKIPRPGGFYIYMRADHGSFFPFPLSEFCFHSLFSPFLLALLLRGICFGVAWSEVLIVCWV